MPTSISNVFKSYLGTSRQDRGQQQNNVKNNVLEKKLVSKERTVIIQRMHRLVPAIHKALSESASLQGDRNIQSALKQVLALNYHADPQIRWEAGEATQKLVRNVHGAQAKLIASVMIHVMLNSDPLFKAFFKGESGTRAPMHLRPSAAYCRLLSRMLGQIPLQNMQQKLAERIEDCKRLVRAYVGDCDVIMRDQDIRHGKIEKNRNNEINSDRINSSFKSMLLEKSSNRVKEYEKFVDEPVSGNLSEKILLRGFGEKKQNYLVTLTQIGITKLAKTLSREDVQGMTLMGLLPDQPEKEHRIYPLDRAYGSDIIKHENGEIALMDLKSNEIYLIGVKVELTSSEINDRNCVVM